MKTEDGGRVEGAPERKAKGHGRLKASKKRGVEKHDLSMVVGPMIHARYERDKSGSYRELEHALQALRQEDSFAWCIIRNQHFWERNRDGSPRRPVKDQGQFVAYARGLMFLNHRMPTPIRVPVSVMVEAEAKKADPRPTRQLARDLGVSRSKIVRQLRRAA